MLKARCEGQPLSLKSIPKVKRQMPLPSEHTQTLILTQHKVFEGHLGIRSITDQYERPCTYLFDLKPAPKTRECSGQSVLGLDKLKVIAPSKIPSESITRMPMESIVEQKNLICPRIFLPYDLNQVLKKKLSIY